jgi:hypothetical protein
MEMRHIDARITFGRQEGMLRKDLIDGKTLRKQLADPPLTLRRNRGAQGRRWL